jgi:AcrR family transcriptional regulator
MKTAFERLYNDGFRNVAIDRILADVGISKTAFYKHFESKDDLLLAALEHQQG